MSPLPYSFDIPEGVLSIIGVVMIITFAFIAIVAVIFYIFEAIALYTIAKKRGIANPWLSFIPIINQFMVGAIADNINAYVNKRTSYRFLLLVLNIVNQLMNGFYMAAFVKMLLNGGFDLILTGDTLLLEQKMLALNGLSGIMGLVSIACMVIYYIALYRIFVDYNQNSAVAFLILSILFKGFGLPYFFLFSLRNKPSASLYYAQQMQQNAMRYQPYQQGNTYAQSNPQPSYQQPVQPDENDENKEQSNNEQ